MQPKTNILIIKNTLILMVTFRTPFLRLKGKHGEKISLLFYYFLVVLCANITQKYYLRALHLGEITKSRITSCFGRGLAMM